MKTLTIRKPLKKGDDGKDVELLQTLLVDARARPKLKIDGKFGPNTKLAVKHFQKLRCQQPSGIVDQVTANMLNASAKLPKGRWPEMKATDWTRRRQKKIKFYQDLVFLARVNFEDCQKVFASDDKTVRKLTRIMELIYTNMRREQREWARLAQETGKAQQHFDQLMIKGKILQAQRLLRAIDKDDETLHGNEAEIDRLFRKAPKIMAMVRKAFDAAKEAA